MSARLGRNYSRRAVIGVALAALVVPALAAGPGNDDARTRGQIRWQSGVMSTQAQDSGQIAQAVDAARGVGAQHVLIQFERPVTDAQRQALDRAGVRLLNYVDDNAYYASINPTGAGGAAMNAVGGVRCVLPVQRGWKLHNDVVADRYPDYAIVSQPKEDPEAAKDGDVRVATPDEISVAAYVLLHPDVDIAQGMKLAYAHGATVTGVVAPINTLVVEMPLANLLALADEDGVQWVEPPLPALSVVNDSNRARVGADTVQAPPYSLNGAGVTAFVYDGGKVRSTHQDLSPRVTINPNDASAVSYHSTHVAGTIGGTGAASGGLRKGMAPAVNIISSALEQVGGLHQGFLYDDLCDVAADYAWAIQHGANIANNSIGTNTAPNGYPCDWEGNYGLTDVLIDTIVRGDGSDPNNPQFNTPFRIVWANGNERQSTRCLGTLNGYRSTAPPACAKNHITVGAMNSNDDSVTSFTSWGPADDGRIKPDISAPGCQSNDDNGVTSCDSSSDTAYTTLCGTSMASPTTCGVGALLIQDFRQQFPGNPDFRNSTLKAILAETAVDLETPGPDYKTGYGSIRAQAAVDLLRAGNFLENTIPSTGAIFSATVIVGPGQPFKVTLAWDDKPGNPAVQNQLVNDLDLRVFDSQNNQYFPWTLGGLANPSAPAVRTQADHVNNIEQVVIDNPTPGGYRIEVYGYNVPQGPQPFSLAASPLLVNCSSQGTAALDREKYACASSATLRVIDCDLNTSDQIIDTVTVNLASTSNPAGLSVLLTEVAPEAATFTGTVVLSTSAGPGELQIAPGDTITLTYNDADNGSGQPAVVTDTAVVDCVGPVISNVAVNQPVNPHDATITFSTNENAQVAVHYGTACGALDHTKSIVGFRTSHTVVVDGLQDNTSYFFSIEAVDEATNSTTDDNGGSCYSFATPEIPDFFTEQFTGASDPFDLPNRSLIWTPNATIDHYSLCEEAITSLPNDPNAGTAFSPALTDDSYATLNLTNGAHVVLYGVPYSTVYVGSNGYLTFNTGESTLTETFAAHFSQPRVSALFDDLNPGQSGTSPVIRYQQLADRLVISFVNIAEYNNAASLNTFQYELFFDGTIKIHYLNVGSQDNIVGLSAGGGVSPDFFESNLSEYGPCGPSFTLAVAPPSATGCAPFAPQFNVTVASVLGFTDPVTLSVVGLPAGVTPVFSPNPVIPGNPCTLTLNVSGAAAAGSYPLQVLGVSGSLNRTAPINLAFSTQAPAAPALLTPANGQTNVALMPTFTWSAVAAPATYDIQVATDAGFTNIVASGTGLTATTFTPASNLLQSTLHYWRVKGTNLCGVSDWSTVFHFTTQDIPDYFTEQFTGGADSFDLPNRSLIWTLDGSGDTYSLCEEAITELPNDPNAGTAFTPPLTDDSFGTINLTGGATVKLYGTAYSTVYVGSNGYLTFTAGDTDYTETLADHFNRPRVSAHFDDMDPNQGGKVRYQQLADRLVVSFLNVPHHNVANSACTFQYEMFFDGTIKIHFLAVNAPDCITGLSNGGGTPALFLESNLSGYPACGPAPCAGDMNCDGTVDFADIDPFVLALSGEAAYHAQYPNCLWLNGDANGDNTVDFADIDAFVGLLFTTCP